MSPKSLVIVTASTTPSAIFRDT